MIYIMCPYRGISGGPENLHQLNDMLLSLNIPSRMIYLLGGSPMRGGKHEMFSYLDTGEESYGIKDEPGNAVVIPEIYTNLQVDAPTTNLLCRLTHIRRYIWWLRGHRPDKTDLFTITPHIPIAECDYIKETLSHFSDRVPILSEYIDPWWHTRAERVDLSKKENLIAYNPKRNLDGIKQISKMVSEFRFEPIQDMSRGDVGDLLSRCKVFLDLGGHPGKDHLPREAATLHCCVLTSRHGATGPKDMPILGQFKFDTSQESELERCVENIRMCFEDYEKIDECFNGYRKHIREQKDIFRQEVESIFGGYR
jgi:hypothetical protein